MNIDNFELIKSNMKIQNYIRKTKKCKISMYHLVTDNNKIELEIDEYKKLSEELQTTHLYLESTQLNWQL